MQSSTKCPLLSEFIKKEYIHLYSEFDQSAMPNDVKGLHILNFILQTKGHKKYSGPIGNQCQKANIQNQSNKIGIQESLRMKRERETCTQYNKDFGKNIEICTPKRSIFAFKDINQLEFKEFLKEKLIIYLNNWISLYDEYKIQELVLSGQRALNSRFRVNKVGQSNQYDTLNHEIKKDWNLSKPFRLDQYYSKQVKVKDYDNEFKQNMKKDWRLMEMYEAAINEK